MCHLTEQLRIALQEKNDLAKQFRVALQQNHALEKKVAELEAVVGELSRRLGLNSRNSSTPSSTAGYDKPNPKYRRAMTSWASSSARRRTS